jgi:hypothetical protein
VNGDVIYIATYQPKGERAHVLTAYTVLEAAQHACTHAAAEYGLGITKWYYDRKERAWVASFKHVSFIIVQRVLDGVSS